MKHAHRVIDRVRRSTTGAALIGFVCLGSLAQANTLEEVVVIAKKRETNLQETVGSITAFSSRDLEMRGIRDLADLGPAVPNLSVGEPQFTGTQALSMRGIAGQSAGIGQDDPVAVYLDGVYVGKPQGQQFALVDVEGIEVLKGPQGTLYGRNATAGAINIKTRRPQETFSGRFEAEFGNFDSYGGVGSVEGAVGANTNARASLYYSDFGGDLKNTFTGSDERYQREWYSRVVLDHVAPSDRYSLTLALDYGDTTVGTALKNMTVDGNRYVNKSEVELDLEGTEIDREVAGAALTYEYDLNESWTLKSITAYRSLDLSVIYDSDGTNTQRYLDAIPQFIPASIAIIRDTGSLQVIEADQYSQELQLSFSNADIDWLLGLYAFRENSDHELVIELLVHSPSPILSTDTTSSNKATSYAAFTHVTYAINDRWELSGGLRYSYEKKAMERAVFSGGALTEEDLDDRWSDPTGEISLSVRLTEDVLGYLSFAQGFKSGGYSSLTRGSPSFAPEYVDAYEVGLKSEFLDRRVRLNLAAFRMDYEDLQVRFPGDVGQLIIQNATEATIDGAELELTALVSDFLTLSLAGAWLDATYGDYSFGGADFSGNRLNQAPEYSFSAVVDYGRQLPQLGELNASLSYYWQDEEFYRAENDDLNGNSGYEVLDGRISLSLDAVSGLSVALWGKNLTNDRYVGAVVPLVADRLYYASINRGRTYGLDVVYEF